MKLPDFAVLFAETVRMELAAPFAVKVRLGGATESVMPGIGLGAVEAETAIEPANPFMLQRPIDDVFEYPAGTIRSDVLELMPKSVCAADTLTVSVAKWTREPFVAAILPMYSPGGVLAGTEIVTVGTSWRAPAPGEGILIVEG